ncbi:tRNA (adenosine(37)-N6)-threonylcarbamoyltransferase complex dimerization subunit type 1 TsaB [Rhizomonospora bruguierae]|uniref:tRNA (adenosine(37)-N6)-threonylcarbamoyltransferase complex dimerization subunit type 1 TsaB n=1 Tax=Rhizomonospora bruguierae TaxID=1581705 RepID=UPI001BCF063D|nr:tRNA (adenosine(37)-N6)-threonylcarbamoyltransferase complex dimerization subunit type 1 TsaB [Micromonospora sp. NBRC 107566]
MLVLVLDSATPAVTAAVVEVGEPGVGDPGVVVRAGRSAVDARAHGELLAPQVDSVLREIGARPRDLAAIVAGLGPGPFTGLRVGLVTAAGMGQALDIPTYGVCSLDALGWSAARVNGPGRAAPGKVLAATDARRREIYWAVYADRVRVTEPQVGRPVDVAAAVARMGVLSAIGEGAHKYAAVLPLALLDEPRYPTAEALAALAAERVRAGRPGERLTPLYLRRPDAVAAAGRKPVLQA